MLVLFLTNLVILVINCDSASVYKEPNKIEIIKEDVGTIVGSLNTFAFDILENILESPSELDANSTDTETTTTNNNNTISKEKVRKVRSVASDELLQLCQKHFKEQCAPKPTKEEAVEQEEIDDLKEEVRQLMIVIDLLAEQEDVMRDIHVQKNQPLNQNSSQGTDLPKLKSEELSEISQNLKTAVVELNDTRKLLDVERSRNRVLDQAIKKQKEEIGKLKEAIEEILSLNLTSITNGGVGSESGQTHQRTRSSSDDSDVTRMEKLLKTKASEDDEVEKKLDDLEKQVARQKLVMRLKRLQKSLALGPNAEKDPLLIRLRKIFRKQPHQVEGKGDDDDDEVVEVMTLEDLQEAFNNLGPKPDKAPLDRHDLVQKLLNAAQGLNVPKRQVTQSSGNWHPYLCMVDYDQDQRNSQNYGSSSGMQNIQFYGPPPELLINQFAMNRPQSAEYFHSNSNSGTKTYPQGTTYESFRPVPSRPMTSAEYYPTSNTGAEKHIKAPHQNGFAKIFSPQSSSGTSEYHDPPRNVGFDAALDIRINPANKPTIKSDQQHESTNYQPVYNSVPSASAATAAYPSGQQKPQFFPLRPPFSAQSSGTAHPAGGSANNPTTYYYAPNSDGPSLRKADFGPEDAAGFGRFQKEMRQEVDRIHAIIRKLQKQRDEGKITGSLWKNRTTRSAPEDNGLDDGTQTLHKVVDLVGQALKEAEQGQSNPDGTDPSRTFGDIENSLDMLKNQLDSNNIERERSSSPQARTPASPIFPPFLPQISPMQPIMKSPAASKDDLFTDLVGKIMEKIVAAVPVVLQKLFNISLEQLTTYDGQDNELATLLKNLGVFGYLPVIILKILSGLTNFVKILKKNTFVKNFLMPALIFITVAGAIVFLVWWLQPDGNEGVEHPYQLQYQQYPQQYPQYPPPSISYNVANTGEYMGVESNSTPNMPIYNRDYYK